ncbi:3-deoxy-manno-octulosonate cytidylyltransferase [Candidatus Thioglobus sp.]|nr:3-deoxy-manno-octulosonate cytidylyltransferase [Candidatus Thioglobus sp.]
MHIIAIIPARMNSSRFPGKPMKNIHGVPMIGHCYHRANLCQDLKDTYVATCDKVIFDYISSIGGKAIMTNSNHERASDRAAEAMLKIEKSTNKKVDIVVMIQGDEPMVTPKMISDSLIPFQIDTSVNVVNLMANINSIEEFEDPNEVKVVVNLSNDAMYFSREPIPSRKKSPGKLSMLKQVCIIPFKRDYLIKFNNTPETVTEIIESIDMMRIIENDEKVRMVMTDENSFSVDTKEDLLKVEEFMMDDLLMKKYIK